jgi:hypothetical protein
MRERRRPLTPDHRDCTDADGHNAECAEPTLLTVPPRGRLDTPRSSVGHQASRRASEADTQAECTTSDHGATLADLALAITRTMSAEHCLGHEHAARALDACWEVLYCRKTLTYPV